MTKLVVITGFIVAFTAGMMSGLVFDRHNGPPGGPGGPGGRQSFIASQLGLTADQQTKMKAIWQDVSRHAPGDQRGKHMAIRHDQEEAIAKLIRPDDKAAYDKNRRRRPREDGRDGRGQPPEFPTSGRKNAGDFNARATEEV